MTKFVLDVPRWLHGEGTRKSFLHRASDDKQCCVGLYLEDVCGIARETLTENKTVFALKRPRLFDPRIKWLIDAGGIYSANDAYLLSDVERRETLKRYFADLGDVELIFSDEVSDAAKDM